MTPLISIIIPTYNRAHTICETLDSVLAQTYSNWECIVVDDGSTDDTENLLKSYRAIDSRIHFFKRPKKSEKGPSSSRNYGLELCKGEFVQWFDSDDTMHPDKIKLKIEAAIKHQADVIIDEHSDCEFFKKNEDFEVKHFKSKDFYINFLLGEKPVITNDVMLKKLIIKHQRFDENLWKGEEYEFFSRVFKQELTYCFLDVVLTHYRISADSISMSKAQATSLIYLSKKLIKDHKNNPLIVTRAKRQGRKTYKSLAKNRKLNVIFKHFSFFKKAHDKSAVVFFLLMVYNFVTGRGFDRVKPKRI